MATNEREVKFPAVGHFGLQLVINTGPIIPVTANYKQELLESLLERRRQTHPERHAIRNLLGVLAFRRGDTKAAEEHFKFILSSDEDPQNPNARANLDFVTSGDGTAAASLKPDLSSEAGRKRQARRFAEQAYAFEYDLYNETVTHGQYTWALVLYKEAMKLASALMDHAEKESWQFGIGLANFKILGVMVTKRDYHEAGKALHGAARAFGAIVGSEEAEDAIKSKAWMHVALTFKKASTLFEIGPLNIPESLVKYVDKPEECLRKARELSPDDSLTARILVHLAEFRNRAGEFDEAMGLLAESIGLDNSKFNFNAYSRRAALCVQKYRQDPSQCNLDLINQAKNDLEYILKLHVSPWDFHTLAEVYYHLARSYITKAFANCTKSEECQDGAKRSGLHKVRGDLYCLIGQHQEAMESYQRGVGCEGKTGWKCGNEEALAKEWEHISGKADSN